MSVALIGIGVNALLLQRERHPAPLFGFAPPKVPSAAPAPAPVLPQKLVSAEDNAPPAQPVSGRSAARPAAGAKGSLLGRPIRSRICWPGKPTATDRG